MKRAVGSGPAVPPAPSSSRLLPPFSERDIERCMWAGSVARASSTRMPSGK